MVSRLALLRELFSTRASRIITGVLAFMAVYQFACDQFGAPTLPNLWGMTGAAALPWWAWLLLAQLGALYGLFEYVRRLEHSAAQAPAVTASKRGNPLETLQSARNTAALAAHQGSETSRARAYHELDAAMLTIEKKFGVQRLHVPADYRSAHGHKDVVEVYVRYVDTFCALLREGHEEQARETAANFKNPWAT